MRDFELFNLMNMKDCPERRFIVAQGASLRFKDLETGDTAANIVLTKSSHNFQCHFLWETGNDDSMYEELRHACAVLYWDLINDGLDF